MITSINEFRKIFENLYSHEDIIQHITNISDRPGTDVPDYYFELLRKAKPNFIRQQLNIKDILQMDAAVAEYVNGGEDRYEDFDEDEYPDNDDLYFPIVIWKNEVIDGYNRLSTLYKQGEKTITAYVSVNSTNEKHSTDDNIQNEDTLELFMLPDFLYHISPIENKNSILNKGIILKTGGTSHLYRTYTPRIYLACSLIAAYDLYLNFNAHNGKEYLIYKIDKNKLSGNIYEDSKFVHGIHIDKNISKEAIIEIIDPNTLKYNEDELDNLYNTTWFDYQNESFYHGTPDQTISGTKGIHVGTLLAATQALEARIGVPAEGTWDGTREYGKTLLAGQKRLEELSKERGYSLETGFNCGPNNAVPQENYYPTQRQQRAKYSDGTPIPFDAKPKIFKVDIIGNMTNWPGKPHSDQVANGLIKRQLNKGIAKSGYYYINIGEDDGSISAVVPDKSFLKIY